MRYLLFCVVIATCAVFGACEKTDQTDATKKTRTTKSSPSDINSETIGAEDDGTPTTTTETDPNNEETAANTDDATPEDETPAPAPGTPAVFALTSSAFQNNQRIPDLYVAKNGGGDQSPPLAWTGVPAGTASFAIQTVDLDFQTPPLIHWLITDIPATSKNLPANIPAGNNLAAPVEAMGANQARGKYRGPNPPNLHRYEFTIYAIKAGQTLTLGADSAVNKAELEAKSLGKATITGTYD